jgi:TRAP-type C4-dicarboxylate transport system permease large subunit
MGMFTEVVSSIILTMPIIYPIITALGFDPIWFGVIVVIVIEIGFMTPPIGMNVFILSGITGIPVGTIFRGVWQFVVIILFCIIIMTIFPEIVTFLPETMTG